MCKYLIDLYSVSNLKVNKYGMQYPSNLETNSISRPRLPNCDHNLTPPPYMEKKMNKKEKWCIVGYFEFRLDQVNHLHFRTMYVTGGRH